MLTEWLLLLVAVLLIGANALFVAAEFSFVAVDRPAVHEAARGGDRRAQSVAMALRALSTQLSGAQLGITASSLLVGYVAEPSVAALIRGPIAFLGVPERASMGVSLTIAFLVATIVQMVFGELVPKNWGISEPMRVARAVSTPQRVFTATAKPLIVVLNGASNRIVRMLGIEPREELASARSARELGSMAVRSAQRGVLDRRLARRVEEAAVFAQRTAADVMTPRPRVTFLDRDTTIGEVLALVSSTGHARFPVTGDSVDDIVGVVHFKAALAVAVEDRSTTVAADIMAPIRAVPSSMGLGEVLGELRGGLQLAVVVDEWDGTDGVVTLEDLVEEVLGDITDEQDRPGGGPRRLPGGGWSIPGLMRPDEVADVTGIALPEPEHSETSGGLVVETLGRFARVGDELHLDAHDIHRPDVDGVPTPVTVRVRVTQVDGRRVARVQIVFERVDDSPSGDDSG
ncbi:hemolysin family protein [Gordonia sp. PKS22-38]|uniref:Hemolysin family protein n=1 Tax=Gordonia prachuapensis TaxID=3115651 RepID=A0ABU7MUX8_9ACTN|nr:hemolysin family protein [Gordonia sp. PKS22-38]